MFKVWILVMIGIAVIGSSVMAQEYIIDTQSSNLKWTGTKVTGKHYGTIKLKDGKLNKSSNNFSGNFTIDMTTIKDEDLTDPATNAKLLGHLKSDDFFSVEKFNTANFKLKSITPYKAKEDEKGNYWVKGDLTIKGITNEIGFPAEISFDAANMKAVAFFTINRAKWDIRYGSGSFFDNLGDKVIYDDIKFELLLVGKTN